jgi:hypothetical protein
MGPTIILSLQVVTLQSRNFNLCSESVLLTIPQKFCLQGEEKQLKLTTVRLDPFSRRHSSFSCFFMNITCSAKSSLSLFLLSDMCSVGVPDTNPCWRDFLLEDKLVVFKDILQANITE